MQGRKRETWGSYTITESTGTGCVAPKPQRSGVQIKMILSRAAHQQQTRLDTIDLDTRHQRPATRAKDQRQGLTLTHVHANSHRWRVVLRKRPA